jgi:hypothetical protein
VAAILYSVAGDRGLVLVGRFLLNPLLRLVGRISERELFVVAGLFTVLGASALMHALGLSPALGAFVGGRDARRFALPARAGGGHRAVPLDPASACSSSRWGSAWT